MMNKLKKIACGVSFNPKLKPAVTAIYSFGGFKGTIYKFPNGEYITWLGTKEEKNLLCLASKNRKTFEKSLQKALQFSSVDKIC